MPYPVHPMDPNDPNYDPKLDPHNPQYTPNDPRLIGGVSPYVVAGGQPKKRKKTITDDDWSHLVTGQPHPSQVAGEDTAPSGSKKIADEDWNHLVTGEPAASPQAASQPPEIPQSTIPDAIPMPGETIPVHPALAGAYRAAGQHPIAAAAAGASIPIVMSPIGGALTGAVGGIAGRLAPYFGIEEMLSGGKYLGKLWDLVQWAGH